MPTIQQIMSAGTVGSMPLLPYTSMLSNAFMWTTYGKKTIGFWLLIQMEEQNRIHKLTKETLSVALLRYYFYSRLSENGAQNMVLQRHWCRPCRLLLCSICPQSTQAQVIVCHGGVAAVILGTLLLAIFKPFANTANLLGNIAVLFCIIMFASPLSVIKVVLETKSAKAIPLPFTLVSCVNCFMWSVFGFFEMRDINVYLPNLLGLTSGLVQVALKIIFGDNDNLPAYATADVAP